MSDSNLPKQKGILEGSSRVIRELLRSPTVKQSLRVLMRDLDPHNAPLLVKALTQADPELTFSALASLPAIINSAAEAGLEISAEASNVTFALREEFFAQFTSDIDAEKLGRLFAEILILKAEFLSHENQSQREAGQVFAKDFAAGFSSSVQDKGKGKDIAEAFVDFFLRGAESVVEKIGEDIAREDSVSLHAVQKITRGANDIANNHPEVIAQVAAPLAQVWRKILAAQNELNDNIPRRS